MIDNEESGFAPASEGARFAEVAGSFDGLHMDRGVEGIERRARSISRTRHAMPALAIVALGAAIGATSAVGPHAAAPTSATAAGASSSTSAATVSTTGSISLTGFSVQEDSKTGDLTLRVKNFSDPSALIAALHKYGVKVQIVTRDLPMTVEEQGGAMIGTSGNTMYTGEPFVRQPDGTYLITITKAQLAESPVYMLVVDKGVPVFTGTHITDHAPE